MKREWVAVKDLLGLDGLPGTVQGIHQKAKREGWRREKAIREGIKGHEILYFIDDLPEKIKNEVLSENPRAGARPRQSSSGRGFSEMNTSSILSSFVTNLSDADKEVLLQKIFEIGIKGILNKLQQPDTSPQATQTITPTAQPGHELTPEETEALIMSLPVRDSLKAAFAMGAYADETADKEILRILKSYGRGASPDGNSIPSVTPDSALKQKSG
ncbi:hypothetical protein JOU96_001934 [Salmonella enterica]|nr:hypothetical protein [Salmonella enterica]EEK4996633.1 hypothetical protein [Salmonella enterica]EHD9189123.1 hypothetical protein [Salmonella enterica]EJN0487901.1 hypothetical protein [Salmonella enterica]ELP2255504.1 hypothetical protein [Salmonella enterica]